MASGDPADPATVQLTDTVPPAASPRDLPAPRTRRRTLAVWTAIGTASFLVGVGLLRTLTTEPAPSIHVQWRDGVSEARRHDLERQFALTHPEHTPPSWAYQLLDTSQGNVARLLRHPDVADTGDLDRSLPDVAGTAPYGDGDTWVAYRLTGVRQPAVVIAIVSAASLLLAGSLLVIRFTGD